MILIKNIQLQQLINLLLLITVSYFNNQLQTNLTTILLLMLFSGSLDLAIKQEIFIPYSAFITALGVVLMLGWLKWYIPYIAITFAILQKHYLKIDKKHIFNPSNFALIVAILLFYPKALPIIGELGRTNFIIYFIIILGSIILIRVNRYLISISFLTTYIALTYFIIGNSDPSWNFSHFLDSLYSTSFIVYIFFMLTDPVTTPSNYLHQIIFGFTVAFTIIILDYLIGIRLWHQFLGLFIVSVFMTPLYREFTIKDYTKFTVILLFLVIITIILSSKKALYFSM